MPETAGRFLDLVVPAPGKCAAAHLLMARVPVGDRDELHSGAQLGEFRGRAAGFAVAIVRVSAKSDHAKLTLLRRGHHDRTKQRDRCNQH